MSVQWSTDNFTQVNILAQALPRLNPGTWYILAADYTFGIPFQKDFAELLPPRGSKIVGAVRHPLNGTDFVSYLVGAQQSGATTVVESRGGDAINVLKQAREFGRPIRITKASSDRGLQVGCFVRCLFTANIVTLVRKLNPARAEVRCIHKEQTVRGGRNLSTRFSEFLEAADVENLGVPHDDGEFAAIRDWLIPASNGRTSGRPIIRL